MQNDGTYNGSLNILCSPSLKVKEIELKSGVVVPAEVMVVGIGKCNTAPNTTFKFCLIALVATLYQNLHGTLWIWLEY